MLPLLRAMHFHAAKRGDGLRNEFFTHMGGQSLFGGHLQEKVSGPPTPMSAANAPRGPVQSDKDHVA